MKDLIPGWIVVDWLILFCVANIIIYTTLLKLNVLLFFVVC